MLEKIREGSQGVVAKGILVLVILSFAFTGVSSYLSSPTEAVVASVNGDDINKTALDQAYQNELSRLKQQMGDMFATLSADDNYMQGVRKSVLERLVADKLMDQSADKLGLRVSDHQIKAAIIAEPAFQTDGKFDNDRYLAVLSQLGYKTNTFRDMMRTDMSRRQLVSALVGSEFVLPSEAKYIADIQGQTRDIGYKVINATPFLTKVSVKDDEVKAFYDANQGQFIRPESVSLEYIELDAKAMANNISISEADAKDYYQKNSANYLSAEKRLAAHIFFAKGTDDAAAKAKAEAVYAKLKAGEDFATLAKAESEDTLSGEQGGKLDWFEHGVMEPSFDDALFALKKGEFSNVVETSFGYHIIEPLDIQASTEVPFESVKAKIISDIQYKKAVDKFYEQQQVLADTSYEVPDTLSESAKELGVEVKTTPEFTRQNPPELFSNPEVLKAAFSQNVLNDKMNSDVIEVSTNHVVVLRVHKHQTAGVRDLAEVKSAIESHLKQEKANEMARTQAETAMTAIKAGDLAGVIVKVDLGRFANDVDSAIVTKAFQMPHPKTAATVDTVALPSGGYAVVLVNKVNAAKNIDEKLVAALKQRLTSQYTENGYRAVIASLKAKAKVTYEKEVAETTELN